MSIITGIALFLIFLSLWGFYLAIHPPKIVSTITPKNFDVAYENVAFKTSDNVLIRGWFIANPNRKAKTIILLHGYPADKGDILPSRIFLHSNYHLLFFDFRSFGESEGKYSTAGKDEVLDLEAAIHFLQSRGIVDVGVWGFSLGGSVALMAAAENPHIKAVVAESAYARLDWIADEYYRLPILRYPLSKLTQFWAWLFLKYNVKQISPVKSAEKLTIPVLLIYSASDNVIPIRHGLLLKKALQNDPHAQFIFNKELSHGEPMANEKEIITQFFAKNLH